MLDMFTETHASVLCEHLRRRNWRSPRGCCLSAAKFCRPVQDAMLRVFWNSTRFQPTTGDPGDEASLRPSVKSSLRPKSFFLAQPLRPNRAGLGAPGLTSQTPIKEGPIFCLPSPSWSVNHCLLELSLSPPPLFPTPTTGRRPLNGARDIFSSPDAGCASTVPRLWLGEVAQREHSESHTIRGRMLAAPVARSVDRYSPVSEPSR
ncbi:hypothetical protein SCHPADRAFT_384228 [Schizopora paradoxa]|uniref:Uncharacterized protein n=1 Tax=Schizopora paradoxa TaxID=27342 RepID=A0A0H2S827_9AGAM|nr:hypothetical protein SCHPADRAFT_384228 [Schizopora paradoxa]